MIKGQVAMGLALAAVLGACSKPTPARSDANAGTSAAGTATANAAANGSGPASKPAAGAAAAPAPANAAAPAIAMNPGEWEMSVETKIAGLPPEMAKMMSGQKRVMRHCLTPEKAAKQNGELFTGKMQKGCTGEQARLAGGRVHGTMECKDPRGVRSTIAIDGQIGGDSLDVNTVITTDQGGRTARIEGHTIGRRIGSTCSEASKDR